MRFIIFIIAAVCLYTYWGDVSAVFTSKPSHPAETATAAPMTAASAVVVGAPHSNNPPVMPMGESVEAGGTLVDDLKQWFIDHTPSK